MGNGELAIWKGSENTAAFVKKQISERWGEEEAEKYDPLQNCFTYKTWRAKGYYVKKGEKAIRSMTLLEFTELDAKDRTKEVLSKRPKKVYLFYYKQVEKKAA